MKPKTATRYITDKEAATLLNVPPEAIRKAVREGTLPGVVIHRKAVRVEADSVRTPPRGRKVRKAGKRSTQ